MRLLMTLLVALLASTSAQAQSLPGPASNGWYVLIGVNPYIGLFDQVTALMCRNNPSCQSERQEERNRIVQFGHPYNCKAMIVPSSYQVRLFTGEITEAMAGTPVGVDFVDEPKRFGPFPSQFGAESALTNSGWNQMGRGGYYLARTGCDARAGTG